MDHDKKYDSIRVYLTGFGPFQSILKNPTEELVSGITMSQEDFKTKKCSLGSSHIFEVNTNYVDNHLPILHKTIEDDLIKDEQSNNKVLTLLIHFGLYAQEIEFNIEQQSTNMIKDEIKKCPISKSMPSILKTKLNCETLMDKLKAKHTSCTLSFDAGTYLCNYIYFLSLAHFINNDNVIVLFIHIPLINIMSIEEGKKCYKAILESLEEIYC